MPKGLKTYEMGRYANLAGSGTTHVAAAAGVLGTLVVNKSVDTATITIYDDPAGTSGAKIATITLSGTVPVALHYGVSFNTGLTIVASGATDITIIYEVSP